MRTCATEGVGHIIRLLFYVLGAFLLALEVQGTAHGVAVRTFGHDGINCSDLLLRQPTAKRESSRFVLPVDCMPSFSSGEAPSRRGQFTGKERDSETGLDYFGARYFSGAQGRFTTADPLMASARASNPQTWNRYSYALNNPLRYVDPDGLIPRRYAVPLNPEANKPRQ
jgi:RHS repeat-associated protein